MRMSAVIVVVAALLVANADAWSRWVKTAASGAAVYALLGKRDVKCTGQLTKEEAAKIAQKLEDTCLKLDFDSEVGLTKDTVDATFAESDANNDGALTESELEKFSDVIDTYEGCDALEQAKRK